MASLKDTHIRSVVKSITWRVTGIIILAIISWMITHDWKAMTLITVIFHGIRVVLYYFHERIWERISWGRVKHPLSELPVKNNLKPKDLEIIHSKLKDLGYID